MRTATSAAMLATTSLASSSPHFSLARASGRDPLAPPPADSVRPCLKAALKGCGGRKGSQRRAAAWAAARMAAPAEEATWSATEAR